MNPTIPSIVLVDDHVLLRTGLANLINSFGEFIVLFQSDNGKQFMSQLNLDNLPDIVLLDINMPEMDGYETASWLKQNHPQIKILALSMYDNDGAIIRMLKNGARGYVLKDIEPKELKAALVSVWEKGYYYSEMITGKLIHNINNQEDLQHRIKNSADLNDRETEFLKWVCTEKTYKEIADAMYLSPRTIDGYRDGLFEKLRVKTRVGLVMYAIKNGIINP
jgi:two-component system, NarL family, invasion response regulator UvrY